MRDYDALVYTEMKGNRFNYNFIRKHNGHNIVTELKFKNKKLVVSNYYKASSKEIKQRFYRNPESYYSVINYLILKKEKTGSDDHPNHLLPHQADRVITPAQVEPVKDIIPQTGADGKDTKVSKEPAEAGSAVSERKKSLPERFEVEAGFQRLPFIINSFYKKGEVVFVNISLPTYGKKNQPVVWFDKDGFFKTKYSPSPLLESKEAEEIIRSRIPEDMKPTFEKPEPAEAGSAVSEGEAQEKPAAGVPEPIRVGKEYVYFDKGDREALEKLGAKNIKETNKFLKLSGKQWERIQGKEGDESSVISNDSRIKKLNRQNVGLLKKGIDGKTGKMKPGVQEQIDRNNEELKKLKTEKSGLKEKPDEPSAAILPRRTNEGFYFNYFKDNILNRTFTFNKEGLRIDVKFTPRKYQNVSDYILHHLRGTEIDNKTSETIPKKTKNIERARFISLIENTVVNPDYIVEQHNGNHLFYRDYDTDEKGASHQIVVEVDHNGHGRAVTSFKGNALSKDEIEKGRGSLVYPAKGQVTGVHHSSAEGFEDRRLKEADSSPMITSSKDIIPQTGADVKDTKVSKEPAEAGSVVSERKKSLPERFEVEAGFQRLPFIINSFYKKEKWFLSTSFAELRQEKPTGGLV